MDSAAAKRKRIGSPDINTVQTTNQGEDSFVPGTAAGCFSKILHDERFCDVTFLVGPSKEVIRAHKIFLKARSAMLRENFSDRWEDKDTIELSQFDPKAFKTFLKFVYTDQVDLEGTDWMSVLGVAHFFLVQPLVDICAEVGLRDACSNIGKAVEAFQTVRFYDHKKTVDGIGDLMANSFVELSRTENFLSEVDDDTLDYLLKLDHLRVNECELFKIVHSVAKARARSRGVEDDDTPSTATMVASEMEKFIPLIRIPTMTLDEFHSVVDASQLLPPGSLLNFYRYFAATNPAEKQAIASGWPYSNAERRCREFIPFYETSPPSLPEIRRKISADGLQLGDCIKFYSEINNLYPFAASRMSSCGSKGFGVTGIGIKCPALFKHGTIEVTEAYFSCRIIIDDGDLSSDSPQERPRMQMTCSVMPNDYAEVTVSPPFTLPSYIGRNVRITVEVTLSPMKEKKSEQSCTLLQGPDDVLKSTAEAKLCSHEVQLFTRPPTDHHTKNLQLIRGIRIQAL